MAKRTAKTRPAEEVLAVDQKRASDAERFRVYHTVPMRDYVAMSGRSHQVLKEQAARYGIPFTGRTISLPAVIHAFHDFFAKHGHRLAASLSAGDDDPLLSGPSSPALERYREARAELAKLDLSARRKDLLPRGEIHDKLMRLASILRTTGETLGRQFGAEAQAVLGGALDEFERECKSLSDE
jgi:hypothetical protein